jgi:CRISPR-associated protein Csb2
MHRSSIKVYVAINDKMLPTKSILQTTPGLTRSKQERTYPTTIPLDPRIAFEWDTDDEAEKHVEALKRLCLNMIRVGHSSSLVRANIAIHALSGSEHDQRIDRSRVCWTPVQGKGSMHARVAGPGELQRLKNACKMERIERFAALAETIESTKGKAQKEAKQVFEAEFGVAYSRSLRSPEPTPATIGQWQGYMASSESDELSSAALHASPMDEELLILSKTDDDQRSLDLADTLYLTSVLRRAIMDQSAIQPVPTWISGHDVDRTGPTKEPHIAVLPLAFVSGPYGDGSIKGLAIAFPHRDKVSLRDRGKALGPLLFDATGEPKPVTLTLGSLGTWTLRLEERAEPPQSLQQRTWTRASNTWASITPVVLDRFPKSSKGEDRERWEQEVRSILMDSFQKAGYPCPAEIDVDTTSWHRGSPRAYRKTRSLRPVDRNEQNIEFGDGFPRMPSRPGKPPRLQIHVYVRFEIPASGPVLVGAGRFQGYGFFKPLRSNA